jgi:hypothetical protein
MDGGDPVRHDIAIVEGATLAAQGKSSFYFDIKVKG